MYLRAVDQSHGHVGIFLILLGSLLCVVICIRSGMKEACGLGAIEVVGDILGATQGLSRVLRGSSPGRKAVLAPTARCCTG